MGRETEHLTFSLVDLTLTFSLLTAFVGSLEISFIILIPSFLTRTDVLHVDVNLFPFHFLEIGAVPLASPFLSSVHVSRAVFA